MEGVDMDVLRNLGGRAAEACGVELVHVEQLISGRTRILRFLIEKENGVNLDDCARVSRQLSVYLEVEDPVVGSYRLEVSSPGVDRPLFGKGDYARFVGKKAQIRLKQAAAGQKELRGVLRGLGDGVVRFEDEKLGTIEVSWENISRGNLIGEVAFPSKPARPRRSKSRG